MFNSLFDGAPVDIMQMLDARERRAHTQQQLLEQLNPCVLVSITLNIPGPVKIQRRLQPSSPLSFLN